MTRPAPACAGTATPDRWFSDDPAEVEQAKATCRTCPLREGCQAGAEARGEVWGVWGARVFTSLPDNPMVVAEPARLRVTVASRHGSRGRYACGCRCEPCTSANRQYIAGYRDHGPAVTREPIVDLQIPLFEGVSA